MFIVGEIAGSGVLALPKAVDGAGKEFPLLLLHSILCIHGSDEELLKNIVEMRECWEPDHLHVDLYTQPACVQHFPFHSPIVVHGYDCRDCSLPTLSSRYLYVHVCKKQDQTA